MARKKTAESKAAEAVYSKEQVLKSKTYSHFRDVYSITLTDDAMYTKTDLDKIRDDFLGRPVVDDKN